MSKVNPSTSSKGPVRSDSRLAGGYGAEAARQTPEALLRRAVMANLLWENIAYMDGMHVSDEIKRLIPLCDPQVVAALAVEAREVQRLRHTPLFIAVEMCRHPGHRRLVGGILPRIITRADMMTDFLALYWREGRVPLCHQAAKGLAACWDNFDEYQLAKYDRNTEVKLRDVLFLSRPRTKTPARRELYRKVAERALPVPETWEALLSSGADKKSVWTQLIESGRLGGLAMLRNLRGMTEAGVSRQVIEEGLAKLHNSMLGPLDYLKAVKAVPMFVGQIEDAMLRSYARLPRLKGKTLFIVDVSGSMQARLSGRSEFTREDAAIAMAMLASNQCEDFELVCTAGDDGKCIGAHEWIRYPAKGFAVERQIRDTHDKVGYGGIFTRQCLKWCRKEFEGEDFERIIIFSDSQDCDFKDKSRPEPFGRYNYICDVSAETKGINYEGVWTAEISGFSEHFITFIASMEGLANEFEEE